MGFINSATTVTVEAFLTAAGRKKLFDSLETVNEPFITKFALGDSDCNYAAVDAGFGILQTGQVPNAGEWKPQIRSFLLQQGMYKPAVAHIVLDGRYGGAEGHYATFPIGANTPYQQKYKFETEWPKGSRYEEDYHVQYSMGNAAAAGGGGLATLGLFFEFFELNFITNASDLPGAAPRGEFWLTFKGGMDLATLQNIIGADNETNNGWTNQVRVEGMESSIVTTLDIDLVQ